MGELSKTKLILFSIQVTIVVFFFFLVTHQILCKLGLGTRCFRPWLHKMETFLRTRDIDGGSSINDATVWAHTVSARCSCLDFETHISVCGVGELQSGSDDICKRAWGRDKQLIDCAQCTDILLHFQGRIKPKWVHKVIWWSPYIHVLCFWVEEYVRNVWEVRLTHVKLTINS